jgi:ABC-type amino acid transport substrate-binding protein
MHTFAVKLHTNLVMMPDNKRYSWTTWWQLILLLLLPLSVSAQTEDTGEYTHEHPLVYEDARDLWPYSFINDEGKPEGYNIDLIDLLMRELHIPYIIKLKPQHEVFQDLKARNADLTLGLAAGFHDQFGLYGRNAITLFTQSVATPKDKNVEIKSFRDLNKPGVKVIVNDSSLCHHLMLDYGWDSHAVVSNNIRESLQELSTKKRGQIVWNTLSLKWLIQHDQINNVRLTPVNMPHGEYKFMSNDQHLLDMLDEAYSTLSMADEIATLQHKWFYPEHEVSHTQGWVWYLEALALLLLAVAVAYVISYRLQNRRVTKANDKLNRRLALIIETSKVRIWTYDAEAHEFAWHNEKGQVAYTYTMDKFAERYSHEDYRRLRNAIDRLIARHKDANGHEEEEISLELQAKDIEGGDHELRDFVVVLSVLRRDKSGKPKVIIGIKKDVTEKRRLKQLEDERTLRYWSIFYSQDTAIVWFGNDGCLKDINPKASEICQRHSDEMIEEHIHISDFFNDKFPDLSQVDKHHTIQTICGTKVEYVLKTVFDDEGRLMGVFAFLRRVLTMLILLAAVLQTSAQALTERYNKERPVVIVCNRDNPPYEFLNDHDEPTGSNVDVIKAVMKELKLPCKFIMKEWMMAIDTFDSGNADLILADGRRRWKAPSVISENVIVFSRVSEDSVTEVHFIGRDRQLIEQMDDKYARLKLSGDIEEIQDRWMHPERVQTDYTRVALYIATALLLAAFILWLLSRLARSHVRKVTRESTETNEIISRALHMGNYDVMLYDITKDHITNQYGSILPQEGMALEEYIRRIHPDQREEFIRRSKSLHEGREQHFELNKLWNQGTDEAPHYLNFQGHAICEPDENGRPAYVINAISDVTSEMEAYHAARDIVHKYDAILSDPFVPMSFYDSKGTLIDHNEAMKKLLYGIDDSLFKEIFKPEENKEMRVIRHLYYPELGIDKYVECHIQPLYNAKGKIANYLVTTNDKAKAT